MGRFTRLSRCRRVATAIGAVVLSIAMGGIAVAATAGPAIQTITPQKASQMTNIDVLRQQIKNYYGAPMAVAGTGSSATWMDPLNLESNYARETESVAAEGEHWLAAQAHAQKPSGTKAIVLDVDDTTLATWNYELYSNWDYNPTTNTNFVMGDLFPAVPGMVGLVTEAQAEGYQVIYITGRPTSQEAATVGNLTGVGLSAGALGQPGIDAGYPDLVNLSNGQDPLFTKPDLTDPSYPQYLKDACGVGVKCSTIQYKSATRAYIESLGYDIVADFGDQYSDLVGGYADRTFKLPNPSYYLP